MTDCNRCAYLAACKRSVIDCGPFAMAECESLLGQSRHVQPRPGRAIGRRPGKRDALADLVTLIRQHGPGTGHELADAAGVSHNYMLRTLQTARAKGVVTVVERKKQAKGGVIVAVYGVAG